MQNVLPQPLSFSLDASASARLRAHLLEANGVRGQVGSYALLTSIGIFNGILYARTDGWQSAFVLVQFVFWSIYCVWMTFRAFGQCTVRPQPATTLVFDETGFSLERRDSQANVRHISCTRVRSVRLTSETLGIYGFWGAYAIVPRTALPDDGTQVMRFLAERIVSQGLSGSTSRGVTTLVNSVTPLFARA